MHQGDICSSSAPGGGAAVVVDMPLLWLFIWGRRVVKAMLASSMTHRLSYLTIRWWHEWPGEVARGPFGLVDAKICRIQLGRVGGPGPHWCGGAAVGDPSLLGFGRLGHLPTKGSVSLNGGVHMPWWRLSSCLGCWDGDPDCRSYGACGWGVWFRCGLAAMAILATWWSMFMSFIHILFMWHGCTFNKII